MKISILCVILFTLLQSCRHSSPISTYMEKGHLVTQIDFSQLQDTLLPVLSEWGSNLKLIALETTDSSLINPSEYLIGNQYIIALSYDVIVLFDRNGKFITKLAHTGRGPGEYLGLLSAALNTKENKLYVLDALNHLHSWDIPSGLYHNVHSCQPGNAHTLKLLDDTTLIIAYYRDSHSPYTLSVQSVNGQFLYGLPQQNHEDKHIINSDHNLYGEGNIVYYHPHRTDSIYSFQKDSLLLAYHFLTQKNQHLRISFLYHDYLCCEAFTITNISTKKTNTDGSSFTVSEGFSDFHLIHLKSRKVKSFRHIQNDYLGNIMHPSEIHLNPNGLFYSEYSSFQLLQHIPEILKNSSLTPEVRQRLEQLLPHISEDNNPFLLIGEFKENIITSNKEANRKPS